MFETIRAHQKWLQAALLVLILPAFVFFGLSGYEGMVRDDRALARIGRESITSEAFNSAQQQQLESLRSMLGQSIDASMFDTPQARSELLEDLIGQRVLRQEAQARYLRLSDERVRQIIMDVPGLKKGDGQFDEARYKALLTAQGLTPARFESQLRLDAAAQLPHEVAQSTAWLPRTVRDRLIALHEEQRVVRWRRFVPADFVAQVEPNQADLEKFYGTHAAEFDRPEAAKVDYVVLSREAVAKQMVLTEEEVQAYYTENAARYEQAEQRRARHILIKAAPDAKARAKGLRERLDANPNNFSQLAKEHSEDPGSGAEGGDLGFFSHDMMVKPFSDAVFQMKEGEVRGPIETEFGQHIIQLVAIKPRERRPLESVRSEIEQALRTRKVTQQYAEAAEAFINRVYEEADSLEPVAQQWKLSVQRAEQVSRDAKAGSLPPELAHPQVLAALFSDDSVQKKRNTEAIEIRPGELVAARLVEYQPARRRPLSEVHEQVRQRVIQEEARRLAQEAGMAHLAALKSHKATLGSDFSESRMVRREDAAGLSAAELQAVFKIPFKEGSPPQFVGVDQEAQGYRVLAVLEVKAASPELIAQKTTSQGEQFSRQASQQIGREYLEALKSRFDVQRFPDRLVKR